VSSPDPAALALLPWRGPGEERPALALPPARVPLRSAGTWRKRWRYVAAFGERLMICGAHVEVGLLGQTFWAILDRASGEITENTHRLLPAERGEVWTERSGGEPWELGSDGEGTRTVFESGDLNGRLHFGDGLWAESVCPNGAGSYVWTRKRVSEIRCDLHLPDGTHVKETMRGIEDESAGYHPKRTEWYWSAGVGTATDGRLVGWNLVEGVNDPPARSERGIWVVGDQDVREPAPISFDGLDAVSFESGDRLEFTAEAERAANEDNFLVKYSYRQPFGSFSGSLDGIELAEGIGVMEHQKAVW
jgi:hypothetical protein